MPPSSETERSYLSLQPVTSQEDQEDQEVKEDKEDKGDQEDDAPSPPPSPCLRRQPRHTNLRRAPSQANMQQTTVPQAILPSLLGSRNELQLSVPT